MGEEGGGENQLADARSNWRSLLVLSSRLLSISMLGRYLGKSFTEITQNTVESTVTILMV